MMDGWEMVTDSLFLIIHSELLELLEGDDWVLFLKEGLCLPEVVVVAAVVFHVSVLRAKHEAAFALEAHEAHLLLALPAPVAPGLHRPCVRRLLLGLLFLDGRRCGHRGCPHQLFGNLLLALVLLLLEALAAEVVRVRRPVEESALFAQPLLGRLFLIRVHSLFLLILLKPAPPSR